MSIFDKLAGQDEVVAQLRAATAAARQLRAAEAHGVDAGATEAVAERAGEAATEAGSATAGVVDRATSEMTHAWLFTGPPGSGRSVAARCFAAALQDDAADSPGGEDSATCRAVMEDRFPDVTVVRPEGLTIGVKEVRAIVARASTFPATGQWQIIIVEDADRLTEQAGNALLKAVEEPSPRTVFMLCAPSDDPQDIMVTLRSRTRHVYVCTPSVAAVAEFLVSRGASQEQAEWAAAVSNGHIGRARALLESEEARERRRRVMELGQLTGQRGRAYDAAVQLVVAAKAAAAEANKDASEQETEDLRTALGAGGTGKGTARALRGSAGVLKELADKQKRRETRMVRDSIDLSLTDLAGFYRDALMQAAGAQVSLIQVDAQRVTSSFAQRFPAEALLRCIDAVSQARTDIDRNVRPELAVGGMVARIEQALHG